MSYFNADQMDHMRALAALPAADKCACGWHRVGRGETCKRPDPATALDPETTPAPVSPSEEFWRRVKLNDGWMWHADSYGSPLRTTKEEATRMDTMGNSTDIRTASEAGVVPATVSPTSRDERIVTRCPACGHQSLFVGSGGHLTCSWLKCPNPSFDDASAAVERGKLRATFKTGFFDGFAAATRPSASDAWEASIVRKAMDDSKVAKDSAGSLLDS